MASESQIPRFVAPRWSPLTQQKEQFRRLAELLAFPIHSASTSNQTCGPARYDDEDAVCLVCCAVYAFWRESIAPERATVNAAEEQNAMMNHQNRKIRY